MKDLDAGLLGRRHPHDVLCCGDQPRTRELGVAAQRFEFRDAEGVVIGKRSRAHEVGAEGLQRHKEFFRPPDPGKGQQTHPGQPLAVYRREQTLKPQTLR